MKRLTNTKIIYHVSEWDDASHNLVSEDYEQTFTNGMTILDLQCKAREILSQWENGIVKIFWGKYQIGTSTQKYNEGVCEYLTNFGKKLCGR